MPINMFGRIEPTDDKHLRLYSLTPATIPTIPTPVVVGYAWYESMSAPRKDSKGSWWIREISGRRLGGHAICVKPPAIDDPPGWWRFYDQGATSHCVGYATCRMMSLLNRARYNGSRVYRAAQLIDEWPGEEPTYYGTSIRAGLDVARDQGLWRVQNGKTAAEPDLTAGIAENRWATSVEEIVACLNGGFETPGYAAQMAAGHVELVNSWGIAYPHRVRLPFELLDRLVFDERGDATVVTDRRA